jgi:hypothetical protein
MKVRMTELPDGYAFTFPSTTEALAAQLVDMERHCCPFLTFKIVVEAAQAAMRLEVTGPVHLIIVDHAEGCLLTIKNSVDR